MHWLLYAASFASGSLAALLFVKAENIIHQNLSVNVALVASVLFVGGIVAQLLDRIERRLGDDPED